MRTRRRQVHSSGFGNEGQDEGRRAHAGEKKLAGICLWPAFPFRRFRGTLVPESLEDMIATPSRTVARQLPRLAGGRGAVRLSDGELLHRFGARRDEAAFAALVERHAGLVFGVAWRVLRHA